MTAYLDPVHHAHRHPRPLEAAHLWLRRVTRRRSEARFVVRAPGCDPWLALTRAEAVRVAREMRGVSAGRATVTRLP